MNESNQLSESSLRQKAHYDNIAAVYAGSRQRAPAYQMFIRTWAERLLQPWTEQTRAEERRNHVILDPMCGHGNLAPFLFEHSDHVVLNDISQKMLDHIPEEIRAKSNILPASDASNLQLEDNSVDAVVISGGLHHVYSTLDSVLEEIHRVLKPGGWFLFGEPSNEFAPIRWARNTIYKLNSSFDAETEMAFRHNELRDAFAGTGFREVTIFPFGSIGYLLMGQVGVIPLLKSINSTGLFRFLQGMDRKIENNPVLRKSCFALTGYSRKPGSQ